MKRTGMNLLAFLASMALLASCGGNGTTASSSVASSTAPTTSESSAASSQEATSSQSQSTPSSESTSIATTYKIVIKASAGVTVTADKAEAEKGETVTLTVTMASGYALEAILLNNSSSAITKVNDATYTFVMPDTSAVITTKVSVSGECVLAGDIVGVLEKQGDGTFKGSVSVENAGETYVKVGETIYGWMSIDANQSFGYYSLGSTIASHKSAIKLGANAIYEITLVPSAEKPLTIYRTGYLHAAKTADEILELLNGDFAGRGVLDGGAYNPRNLTGVTYKNNALGVSYQWDLYENNASLGTAVNMLDEEDVSYVYHGIVGNELKVVDNYIEAVTDSDGVYYDDSMKTDKKAYSATYQLVDSLDSDNDPLARYKRTEKTAKEEMGMPSHNMYGLSREIYEGYRSGFTVEDDLVASKVTITPTVNADEGFTVDIYSWKNYDPNGSTYDDVDKIMREEFKISLTFNKDTTVSSATYLKNYYDETSWKFDNTDTVNGGSAIAGTKPTVKRKSSFAYAYGAKKAGSPDFSTTPYFVSDIHDAHATSKGLEQDHIQQKDIIDQSRRPMQVSADEDSASGYTSLLKYDYSPATALDTWQYGVVSSTNESVVGLGTHSSYSWEGLGKGSATLGVGNHVGSGASTTFDVTVDNDIPVRHYYVWSMDSSDEETVSSVDTINMNAGKSLQVYLWGSPNNAATSPSVSINDENISLSLSGLVKPTAWSISSYPTYVMTIDATKLTLSEKKTYTITVSDPDNYEEGWGPDKITLNMSPSAASKWPDSVVGTTWTGNEEVTEAKAKEASGESGVHVTSSITFTDADFSVEGYKVAKLHAESNGETVDDEVGYKYDPNSTKIFSFAVDDYDYTIVSTVDVNNGYFGLVYYSQVWGGGEDVEETDILGYPEDDGDVALYQWFTQNA